MLNKIMYHYLPARVSNRCLGPAMGIGNDELQVPITREVRNLVQRAYDAGCARGREEMLALQGLDAGEVGDDVRRLRRHLAELKEIVSLALTCRAMSKGLR